MREDDVPSAQSRFACTTIVGHQTTCVTLAGELDVASTTQVAQVLSDAAAQARRVVLDLRDLTVGDPSGLLAIVASLDAFENDRHLVVLGAEPS
jgi:anti-anti-sigma factor